MDPATNPNDMLPNEAAPNGVSDERPAAEAMGAELADAARPLKQKAQSLAEEQKAAGAEGIGDVARAVHGAADDLEDRLPRVAGYVHDAAQHLDDAASSLRERNLDELLAGFGRFARNQPGAVFGGALLAGFAFSRFLKSSGAPGCDQARHSQNRS